MEALTDTIMGEETARARLALLLHHFSDLDDEREPWRLCIHSRRSCCW